MEKSNKSILFELIRLSQSSERKYREKNFKASLEDKLKVRSILKSKELFCKKEIIDQFNVELANLHNSKFDLIKDHKMKINDNKRKKIIELLEKKSEQKYLSGDYEGAIKALRRAEKYQ